MNTNTVYKCTHKQHVDSGFKWYVQTYHNPTGIPMDEQHCPKFRTKKEATEAAKIIARAQ